MLVVRFVGPLAVLVLSTLSVAPVNAAGDAVAGKEKSVPCQACHGADGNSAAPNFPRLAGQYADYLAQALKSYKDGTRKDPVMGGQVASLSEADMGDLAAYFASQKGLHVIEVSYQLEAK